MSSSFSAADYEAAEADAAAQSLYKPGHSSSSEAWKEPPSANYKCKVPPHQPPLPSPPFPGLVPCFWGSISIQVLVRVDRAPTEWLIEPLRQIPQMEPPSLPSPPLPSPCFLISLIS